MTDPLEQVLAAEAASRDRIAKAQLEWEEKLQQSHLDASRIKTRNEQRTRRVVERAERRSVEKTVKEIQAIDNEVNRQLEFDKQQLEQKLSDLVDREIATIWPNG